MNKRRDGQSPSNIEEYKRYLKRISAQTEDPDHGFFGPDSMAWRVNREGVLGLGALRALLMQVAHPKVAQGVADHSDFRGKPIQRVVNTLRMQQVIVFGTCQDATEALLRIYGRHTAVKGVTRDFANSQKSGTYQANDPDLQMWVFATLIDSMMRAYDQYLTPLSEPEREDFYQESLLFAHLMGIPREILPDTLDSFEIWMEAMLASDQILISPTARDIAQSLLRLPLPIFWPFNYILAAGSLPPRLREAYGLKWNGAIKLIYDAGVIVAKWVASVMPARLRWLPPYWRAVKRIREKKKK